MDPSSKPPSFDILMRLHWLTDAFPEGILLFAIAVSPLAVMFILLQMRIASMANVLSAWFGTGTQTIEQQKEALQEFAATSVVLLVAGVLGPIFWAIVYSYAWEYPDPTAGGWTKWWEDLGTNIGHAGACAFWHAWKGIPESILGWLSYIFSSAENVRTLFGWNCSAWYKYYSYAIAYSVTPIIFMAIYFAGRVTWSRLRRSPVRPSPEK
jgi:hypothetical protein